jgi:hypothetical protein
MQDINLLQNKLKDKTNQWEKSNRVITVLLLLVLLAEVVIGGFFFMLRKQAEESKAAKDAENVSLQNQLDDMEDDLTKAKGFQAQSINIKSLLEGHVGWAPVIDEITSSMYKFSQYFSMTADTSGRLHVEGQAGTYSDVGKLLLALETSDNIKSVKLLSTSRAQGAVDSITFSLDMVVNQELLVSQY